MGKGRHNILHEQLYLLVWLERQMANSLSRLPYSIEMVSIVEASLDGKGGTQVREALIYCEGLDGGALDDQMNGPRNPGIPQTFDRKSATLGERQTHPDTRKVIPCS